MDLYDILLFNESDEPKKELKEEKGGREGERGGGKGRGGAKGSGEKVTPVRGGIGRWGGMLILFRSFL